MRHAKLSVLSHFGASFCSILRPLLATLLHPWVAEFAASILLLEDATCEISSVQHLRAAYVQTVEQFAERASETGEQSFAMALWRHSENRGEDAGVPRAPFKQCWFVREEAEHTRISRASSTLPSWVPKGARQKPTELEVNQSSASVSRT